MRRTPVFFVFFLIYAISAVSGFADTVILKNGDRIKGLILEEFRDRIVMSTPEGEKTVLKSFIRSAAYDSEARALLSRTENQIQNGQYVKAYYTCKKAFELDPECEDARERLHYLRNFLENKTRNDLIENVNRRGEGAREDYTDRLSAELGLEIEDGDKYVCVRSVNRHKLLSAGGQLQKGDRIVKIWGEKTAYMDACSVSGKLLALNKEIRMTIERTVTPDLAGINTALPSFRNITGADIRLCRNGLITENVEDEGPFRKSGIIDGDLVDSINGKATRYMPVNSVLALIMDNRDKKIEVVIRRDVKLWRKK
ncbi:MAG: PDZ domain-containing protein [Candidatus Omnitrophota bacterium]